MRRALDALIVLLAASLLFIAAIGAIDVEAGPLHVRVHDWTRPLALLALALTARGTIGRIGAAGAAGAKGATGATGATGARSLQPARGADLARYIAAIGMLALLLAAAGSYARYHVPSAGGLDSYGYVSAARLLASGHVRQSQPLAAFLPFDTALNAATPLGHVPSADGKTSVPRFPLGLPAVMAAATIFGPDAVYFVPMLMAFGAIVLAYLIASNTRAGNVSTSATANTNRHCAGLLAASLLAVDPLFVAYAIQPMSDVPAVCWLLAAVWLTLEPSSDRRNGSAIAGGICAGMAMLTRSALLPAVITLVLVAARQQRWRPVVPLAVTIGVFIAFQAALNVVLFGGVASSGYGTTAHMFELSWSRLSANVSNFSKWLTYSHTPLFWLVWPMALWSLRAERWAWHVSAVAVAAAAPYLFYIVFDDWESSRFLLPTIALIAVLFARAVWRVSGTHALSPVLMLAIALGCGAASQTFLRRHGIERLATLEAKYPITGEWFAAHTPEHAVVLAGLHSGAIRLYGQRATIRWDEIPRRALAPTIAALVAAGREPYLALDAPSEPPLFDARFAEESVNIEQVARVRVVNIYKFVSAH